MERRRWLQPARAAIAAGSTPSRFVHWCRPQSLVPFSLLHASSLAVELMVMVRRSNEYASEHDRVVLWDRDRTATRYSRRAINLFVLFWSFYRMEPYSTGNKSAVSNLA